MNARVVFVILFDPKKKSGNCKIISKNMFYLMIIHAIISCLNGLIVETFNLIWIYKV